MFIKFLFMFCSRKQILHHRLIFREEVWINLILFSNIRLIFSVSDFVQDLFLVGRERRGMNVHWTSWIEMIVTRNESEGCGWVKISVGKSVGKSWHIDNTCRAHRWRGCHRRGVYRKLSKIPRNGNQWRSSSHSPLVSTYWLPFCFRGQVFRGYLYLSCFFSFLSTWITFILNLFKRYDQCFVLCGSSFKCFQFNKLSSIKIMSNVIIFLFVKFH